jgi:hypothetical protein
MKEKALTYVNPWLSPLPNTAIPTQQIWTARKGWRSISRKFPRFIRIKSCCRIIINIALSSAKLQNSTLRRLLCSLCWISSTISNLAIVGMGLHLRSPRPLMSQWSSLNGRKCLPKRFIRGNIFLHQGKFWKNFISLWTVVTRLYSSWPLQLPKTRILLSPLTESTGPSTPRSLSTLSRNLQFKRNPSRKTPQPNPNPKWLFLLY